MSIDALSSFQQRHQMNAYRWMAQKNFVYDGSSAKPAIIPEKVELTEEGKLAAQRMEKSAQARAHQVSQGIMPLDDNRDDDPQSLRQSAEHQARLNFFSGTQGLFADVMQATDAFGSQPTPTLDGEAAGTAAETAPQTFGEWKLTKGI